ncbi:hypothetical protein KP509_24G070100 [Ceratopteris richardii]|uniref:Uncharacterized protein n=1 Tax=Ceratopteris richardii TaxID=49495 RepID=A0A8T2RVT9_CERRI|nr:hypothetical protein KP509_24G070100 [Ceratopteris richardii]
MVWGPLLIYFNLGQLSGTIEMLPFPVYFLFKWHHRDATISIVFPLQERMIYWYFKVTGDSLVSYKSVRYCVFRITKHFYSE